MKQLLCVLLAAFVVVAGAQYDALKVAASSRGQTLPFQTVASTYQTFTQLLAVTQPQTSMINISSIPDFIYLWQYSGYTIGDMGDFPDCNRLDGAKYCLVSLLLPSCDGKCLIGLCLPTYIPDELISAELYNLTQFNSTVTCGFTTNGFSKITEHPRKHIGTILFITFSAVMGFLVVIGTIVHALSENSLKKQEFAWLVPCLKYPTSDNADLSDLDISNGKTRDSINLAAEERQSLLGNRSHAATHANTTDSAFVAFFKCFSLGVTLKSLKTPIPGEFGMLNGMRVLSMFWVILSHTYLMGMIPGIRNIAYVFTHDFKQTYFQLILNGVYSVDSFFFISGFLVTYYLVVELRKPSGHHGRSVGFWVLFYLHRIVRILPLYAYIIWAFVDLLPYLGSSQFYPSAMEPINKTTRYCWTNLLFINNFYPDWDHQCASWGWYLANDMQFFAITPFIIAIYEYFHRIVGWLLIAAMFVGCMIANGYIVYQHDYGVSMMDAKGDSFANYDYQRPYTRINPYLAGMVLALVLHSMVERIQRNRAAKLQPPLSLRAMLSAVRLPTWLVAIGWVVAGGVMLGLLLSTGDSDDWSRSRNVAYMTFGRSAWGAALLVISFLGITGYGGVAAAALAARVWDPLAKLTYAAYLVHPMIILVVQANLYQWGFFQNTTYLLMAVAYIVVSYATAVLLYVAIEKPFASLEHYVLTKVLGVSMRGSGGH